MDFCICHLAHEPIGELNAVAILLASIGLYVPIRSLYMHIIDCRAHFYLFVFTFFSLGFECASERDG